MTIIKIKDKDYQLKLTTRGCVSCEKRLGKNPLNVFMEAVDNRLPKIGELMILLHECILPYNHNISLNDVYDLFDSYCEEGGNLTSLLETLIDVLKDSGFIPKEDDEKNV